MNLFLFIKLISTVVFTVAEPPRAANLNDRKNGMEPGTPGPRAENRDRPEFVTEGTGRDKIGGRINFFFNNSFAPRCASMPLSWPRSYGRKWRVKKASIKLTVEPLRGRRRRHRCHHFIVSKPLISYFYPLF